MLAKGGLFTTGSTVIHDNYTAPRSRCMQSMTGCSLTWLTQLTCVCHCYWLRLCCVGDSGVIVDKSP